MNRYYTYDTMQLWDRNAWNEKISPMNRVFRFMAEKGLFKENNLPHNGQTVDKSSPYYHAKYNCFEDPEAVSRFKGLHFEANEAGQVCWIAMTPEAVLRREEHDPQTLVVVREADVSSPFWAVDTLELYQDYCSAAAESGTMLFFIVTDNPAKIDLGILILRELAQRYDVNFSGLYMDLSSLYKAGFCLADIKDPYLADADGKTEVLKEFGVRTFNFAGTWAGYESLEFANFTPGRLGNIPFDYDKMVHSLAGKMAADAMQLEFDYRTGTDEGLLAHLKKMGLSACIHEIGNRQWVCVVPSNVSEMKAASLPCMVVLQEISKADPHSIPSAYSLWYEYLNIAAHGDLMLIFWVLETTEENELLCDILKDAAKAYPMMDSSRVYITGHSHNGHYAMYFGGRHPELIAGIATMGNQHGLAPSQSSKDAGVLSAAEMDRLSTIDMPLININGEFENTYIKSDIEAVFRRDTQTLVTDWKNRLRVFHCDDKSDEEILAVRDSGTSSEKLLGVPVDHLENAYLFGDETVIGDVTNKEGKQLLRLVTIRNYPHATTAHMPWLSWSFLSKFKRAADGTLIDLEEN